MVVCENKRMGMSNWQWKRPHSAATNTQQQCYKFLFYGLHLRTIIGNDDIRLAVVSLLVTRIRSGNHVDNLIQHSHHLAVRVVLLEVQRPHSLLRAHGDHTVNDHVQNLVHYASARKGGHNKSIPCIRRSPL